MCWFSSISIETLTSPLSQVLLRWSLRSCASLGFGAGHHGRCLVRRPPVCRLLSSSSTTDRPPRTPKSPPTTELLVRSLLDMGFTDTQAELLNDTVSKAKGSAAAAQQTLSALTALLVLGLNPSSVLKVLEKCPELYHVKESEFNQRINNLRKLGLVEGEMKWLRNGNYHEYYQFDHFLNLSSPRESPESGGPLPPDPHHSCETGQGRRAVHPREVPLHPPTGHRHPQRSSSRTSGGPGPTGVQVPGQNVAQTLKDRSGHWLKVFTLYCHFDY